MTGYVRQSTADIQIGEVVSSAPLNLEFDTLQSAFDGTTGHAHDGTLGNGPLLDLTISTTGTLSTARGGTGVTTGLTVLNGTNITSGTVADARLPTSLGAKTFTGVITANANVAFPAVRVASSNVNTLDDYREGTYVPVLAINSSSTGITYGDQFGAYTKVGNRVDVEIEIALTNKGANTGIITITLPFAPKYGTTKTFPFCYQNCTGMTGNEVALMSGSDLVLLRPDALTQVNAMPDSSLTNTSILTFAFSYIAT